MRRRRLAGTRAAVSLAGMLALAACGQLPPPPPTPPAQPRAAVLTPSTFDQLPGWNGDDHAAVLPVLLKSCGKFDKKAPDKKPFGDNWRLGTYGEWRKICTDASHIRPGNEVEAKYFFETRFKPYLVAADNGYVGGDPAGLFTGYYEPELHGDWRPHGAYRFPIYSRPSDLVSVDLGKFRPEYKGEHIAGRIKGDQLVPYPTRKQIDQGALVGKQLEILWVNDPVDLFFLHIQGSGRVVLPDGSSIRVGYAGRNGRRYTPVGRVLVGRGDLRQSQVSLHTIRQWLEAHPAAAQQVMWQNRSYVFFRVIPGDGPIGSEGVVLTPLRSLAVDRRDLPLGVPLWVSTTLPTGTGKGEAKPFRRLMVAQDTGSAIKGPVRGDVFVGHGAHAGDVAGEMKQAGRYWVLLPAAAKSPLEASQG